MSEPEFLELKNSQNLNTIRSIQPILLIQVQIPTDKTLSPRQ